MNETTKPKDPYRPAAEMDTHAIQRHRAELMQTIIALDRRVDELAIELEARGEAPWMNAIGQDESLAASRPSNVTPGEET